MFKEVEIKEINVNGIRRITFTNNEILKTYDRSSNGGRDSEPGTKIFKEWGKVIYRSNNKSIKKIWSNNGRFHAG